MYPAPVPAVAMAAVAAVAYQRSPASLIPLSFAPSRASARSWPALPVQPVPMLAVVATAHFPALKVFVPSPRSARSWSVHWAPAVVTQAVAAAVFRHCLASLIRPSFAPFRALVLHWPKAWGLPAPVAAAAVLRHCLASLTQLSFALFLVLVHH